jgi:hypothetical protein
MIEATYIRLICIEKTLRDAIDRWMYLDGRARSIELECLFEYDDVFL